MKKIIKSRIFYFLLGAILFGGIGVYATTILASQVIYTNNNQENVQNAIDDLYTKVKNPICKRATTLHTETCNQTSTSAYCSGAGYTTGSTITYGNLGTKGTSASGDAFDCDVDGTGYNHRFYFVSYKYIGGTTGNEAYDTNTATLIYYNNVSGGLADNTTTYTYDSDNTNYNGPVTAVQQLPKTGGTNAWSKLKSTKRTILNEIGGNTTNSGSNTLPGNGKVAFDYGNYAARLLTYQEVVNACGSGTLTSVGYLDNCIYLMENTRFSSSGMGTQGYWLETPRSSISNYVLIIHGYGRYVYNYDANYAISYGVRPVIDISINDIQY